MSIISGNQKRVKRVAIYNSIPILQMANELGIKYNVLQRIVNGKRKLDEETASKIANRYGISEDFMLGAFPKNKKELEIESTGLSQKYMEKLKESK